MSPLCMLVAVAALGIEVGWKPLAEGGHEYTIEIEPGLLDVLKQGTHEITSEVPPGLDVRSYRIMCGTGKVPRIDGPPAAARGTTQAAPTTRPAPTTLAAPEPNGPVNENEPPASATAADTVAEPHGPPLNVPHELPPDMGPKPLENHPAAFNESRSVDTEKPALKDAPHVRGRRASPLAAVSDRGGAVVLFAGSQSVSRLDRLGRAQPVPPVAFAGSSRAGFLNAARLTGTSEG